MKKVYYILTSIAAVLVMLLFVLLAVASLSELPLALFSLILAGIAAGFIAVSILGLIKDSSVFGVVLEKIGILLIGFGLAVLLAGITDKGNIIQALIIFVPAFGVGAFSFKKGIDVIRKKKVKQEDRAGNFSENSSENPAGNAEWNAYLEKLCEKMPYIWENLREGASMDDIKAAETEMGVLFPDELKGLYLANDGDNGESVCGMMLGFRFLSLESMRSEWRRSYSGTKWIPIASDGGGNFIGVDLGSDGNSKAGQVINYGRDEQGRTVLAENLGAFFERFTRIVCSEDFYIGEYDDEKVILLGTDDIEEGSYLTDYLKSEKSVK